MGTVVESNIFYFHNNCIPGLCGFLLLLLLLLSLLLPYYRKAAAGSAATSAGTKLWSGRHANKMQMQNLHSSCDEQSTLILLFQAGDISHQLVLHPQFVHLMTGFSSTTGRRGIAPFTLHLLRQYNGIS